MFKTYKYLKIKAPCKCNQYLREDRFLWVNKIELPPPLNRAKNKYTCTYRTRCLLCFNEISLSYPQVFFIFSPPPPSPPQK